MPALLLPAAAWHNGPLTPKVKELYEAAKKEGRVIIWGTQRREVEWIPAAFGQDVPRHRRAIPR